MPSLATTQLIHSAQEARAAVESAKQSGELIGFVPTMGALHEGHLSLVEASLDACDRTVVSIFVNPTQFGPNEDLDRYPRDLEQDLQRLEKLGCWLVFAPSTEEMYPPGSETLIDVGSVASTLEGAARPTHFPGVATVVLKLFQIIPADRAFFGQKDYQQTLVVKQLVRDLSVPTEVVVCPTIREPDGLAMSSRNAYLSTDERHQALSLWKSLQLAKQLVDEGVTDVMELEYRVQQHFAAFPGVEVDYVAFVEAGTVQPLTKVDRPTVMAVAARVGKTRLIDNQLVSGA